MQKLLFLSFYVITCQRPAFAQFKQNESNVFNLSDQSNAVVEKARYFIVSGAFSSALRSIEDSAAADPGHEHVIAFGRDSAGNIITSPMDHGEKSNCVLPTVPNAFADLHTHPNNTPPSSGDLYGLLRKFQKDNRYDMRLVLLAEGSLYAFVISDTAAAIDFLENYPPERTPGQSPLFPDDLLNEYRDMIYRDRVKEEMAMAFIPQKYRAGVLLLKRADNGSFVPLLLE